MKPITQKRNVKASVPLPQKGDSRTERAVQHRPDTKPKNKRAK